MRIKKIIPVLEYINSLSEKKKKSFFSSSHPELILALSELCANINSGGIPVPSQTLKKLRPYKKKILFLSDKKPNLKKRQATIQTGGWLSSFLSTILPFAIEVLFPEKK